MSDYTPIDDEPRHIAAPPARRAAFREADPSAGSRAINERRARTENPDLLRRLRSL